MPTGFPVENSCLAANPWVTFSSQSLQRLRHSPVLCQLWWESDYANMAERWRAVESKVETLAVEGTPSVQPEELRFSCRSSALFFGWLTWWTRLVKNNETEFYDQNTVPSLFWASGKTIPWMSLLVTIHSAEVSPTAACHQRLLLDKVYTGV